MMVGTLVSSWEGLFSAAMLGFRGVFGHALWLALQPYFPSSKCMA